MQQYGLCFCFCSAKRKQLWDPNPINLINLNVRCHEKVFNSNQYVSVCGSGGDGSCPDGDPAWSPVGRQPPLRPGAHRPALQWAATSLWRHHLCHTHKAGLAHPSKGPAAPPRSGKKLWQLETCTQTEDYCSVKSWRKKKINCCVFLFNFAVFLMQTTSSLSCVFVLILKC